MEAREESPNPDPGNTLGVHEHETFSKAANILLATYDHLITSFSVTTTPIRPRMSAVRSEIISRGI